VVDLERTMVTPQRLKYSEIAAHRAWCVLEQKGTCALCEQPLALADAVLDHRHSDGQIRQAIHRFCNTFLGKIENNIARNKILDIQLTAILRNYQAYVAQQNNLLHPTFKTPEERKVRARKRAQARRKKKP
jgi:hypothetical protein